MPALPTPTALTPTVPYASFGLSLYFFVPTIANLAAPTLAEFNAGKNLTGEVANVTGFDTQQAELPVPRAGTYFTGNLPGRVTPNPSSIEFYLSQAGPAVDVRSVFSRGLVGNIVIANEGLGSSGSPNACDIFPVRVGSISIPQGLEVVKMAMVSFSIYKDPQLAVTIPTA